jgi:hypothetical protein
LKRHGNVSRSALVRLLASKPSLEVYRRAEWILNWIADAPDEERSALACVAVLEKLGSVPARKLLHSLVLIRGESPLTRAAKEALDRLESRKK